MPLAFGLIGGCTTDLAEYQASLAKAYTQRLEELVAQKTAAKERTASKLSDTERALQEDRDWLAILEDKLVQIERS